MARPARIYRHRPQEVTSDAVARAHSEADLQDAIGSVARAFNLTSDPALRYGFDAATRSAVEALCIELVATWQRGRLATRAGAVAAEDARFQRMLARVMA